jgi:CPA2 family monovalent cation:H+ antiporter-2
MDESSYLGEVVILLAAAVLSAWLFERLKLGSIIGYLVAGALIGPAAFGLVTSVETIGDLADLGVAFLLFTIGLELPLERLRVMPASTYALGAGQILVTLGTIAMVAVLAGLPGQSAFVVGAGLALSSTTIVLRLLAESGELPTHMGRTAFSVLLMQDLAVAPLLVVVLGLGSDPATLFAGFAWMIGKAAIALAIIVALSRYLLRPLLAQVAAMGNPELFTGLTLLVVICTGLATERAGLSLAFGAFLAGMLLADTRYRHQLAAEIMPFRGLLLGLFFMTVGIGTDLGLLRTEATVILPLALALLLLKAAILLGLARLAGLTLEQSAQLGVLLAQGGEFAFVLLGAGTAAGIVPAALGQVLVVTVALTMAVTPGLAWLGRRLARWVARSSAIGIQAAAAELERLDDHVIIAGFGRVGSAVARRLDEAAVRFVAIDRDPRLVVQGAAAGLPVYYGDATRPEVMEALQIARARAVIVALDNPKAALQLVALLHYVFPQLTVLARAYDETHAIDLRRAGASTVVPETVALGAHLVESMLATVERSGGEPAGAEQGRAPAATSETHPSLRREA